MTPCPAGETEALRFVPLTQALADRLDPWFEDPETSRFFGPKGWLQGVLALQPYAEDEGARQWYWAVLDGPDTPVAAVTLERFGDEARFSLAVDPARRRQGIGRRVVATLLGRPELATATVLEADVEDGNDAAAACLAACGFALAESPDDEGWQVASLPLPPGDSAAAVS